LEIGRSHRLPNQGSTEGGRWQPFCFSPAAAGWGQKSGLLLLISCQDQGHKLGCDRVHAQFFGKISLACPITNSQLLSNVVNDPTSILTDDFLNSGFVQLVGLPVFWSSSTDVRPVLNRACNWNTCVWLKLSSPKACWIIVRVSIALFPRLAQNLMHTRCSFLWSIVKIATGHVHDSKQTRVKIVHAHLATCNLAHWLTRHGSPTIHRGFALPQLLYRWWHQSEVFWITLCMFLMGLNLKNVPLLLKIRSRDHARSLLQTTLGISELSCLPFQN
jgi:hypothetical protein